MSFSGSDQDDIITHGKHILIRRTFEKSAFKMIKVGSDKFFYFGKQKINITSLIGQKFGSTFELTNDKNLKLVNWLDYSIKSADSKEENIQKDNRFINDDNKSQKLTKDDIEKIKREISGKELIQTLVENSATFGEKNKFSQQKYLAKKQQKYFNLFTVLKPSIKFLMEMYYAKGPAKNCYLRLDSLSQMLTLCNVMAGGRYMVLDSNLGILSAALMERTGGMSAIVQIFTESIPNGSYRQAVHALNYPDSTISSSLFSIGLDEVMRLSNECNGSNTSPKPVTEQGPMSTKKEKRLAEVNRSKEVLRNRDMDGLLILTKDYDPLSLVSVLLDYLGLSRPFVIFCSAVEPLKLCYVHLRKYCINLRITETWLRKYQVLPDRTRPEMMMNPASGFLLSGIKVQM